MVSSHRAAGYCVSPDCEDFATGVILLNHGDTFHCPRCNNKARIKHETGRSEGSADYFSAVHVHFNYCPILDKYREVAIVADWSMPKGQEYFYESPLVRTPNRALKVAESILGNLNRYGLGRSGMPKTRETTLSFDDSREEFSRKLKQLEEELKKSQLSRAST